MQFDYIVGNPPYNNDIYIDFINLAHPLAKEKVCLITPAKWYCKADYKNEIFRNNIVPYMEDIVVYRDTKDIFDIGEAAGITYFTLTKNISDIKNVKSVCKRNQVLNTQTFEKHTENPLLLYPNKIIDIINKIQTSCNITLDNILNFTRCVFTDEQEYGLDITHIPPDKTHEYYGIMQSDKCVGYIHISNLFTTENLNKYKCIQACMSCQGSHSPFDNNGLALGSAKVVVITPKQVPKGSFPVIRYFDTEQEAKNFQSYMHSRLVSFLQFIGLSGTTITKEFYRFVPDQENWTDSIWSESSQNIDKFLYEKYKITNDEIQLIESIIKQNDRA